MIVREKKSNDEKNQEGLEDIRKRKVKGERGRRIIT